MTTAVIVQARMGSSRLPGKVMARAAGRPLLAWLLDRLYESGYERVVATTVSPLDDPVADLARLMGWQVFRGSEHDVMSRYIGAADLADADTVVRVTSDCPLLDPQTVDQGVVRYEQGDADWVSYRGLPDGAWCEVVSTEALRLAYPKASTEEREHVTLYLRRRPWEYRLRYIDTGLGMDEERWSVDTAADLAFVRKVLESMGSPAFSFEDVRRAVARHPEWRALNAGPLGPIDQEMLARLSQSAMQFEPLRGDL